MIHLTAKQISFSTMIDKVPFTAYMVTSAQLTQADIFASKSLTSSYTRCKWDPVYLPGQVFPEDLPKLVLVGGRVPFGVPQMFRHEVLYTPYHILIRRLREKPKNHGLFMMSQCQYMNILRIYTNLSIWTSNSKFNLPRWKSTCYWKHWYFFIRARDVKINLSDCKIHSSWTSVKNFTGQGRTPAEINMMIDLGIGVASFLS